MSDYERGPYTPPSEQPLAFDPRRPVRGAGPVPVTLIISAVVLIGLVGAVAFVYRGGIRHPNQAPAQVGTPVGDYKSAAPPEAPSNDAAAGLVIEKTDASNATEAANAIMAVGPETPAPRAALAPGAVPPPPPAQAVAAPAAQPAPAKLAVVKAPAAPPTIGSLADAAVATKKPVKVLTKAAIAKPAAAKPAQAAAATPVVVGAGWVQIGVFSSQAHAEKGWNDIAKLDPAAMAGKGKKVVPLPGKDGADLYRTYITGFSGHAAALKFCEKLVAAGKSCLVK